MTVNIILDSLFKVLRTCQMVVAGTRWFRTSDNWKTKLYFPYYHCIIIEPDSGRHILNNTNDLQSLTIYRLGQSSFHMHSVVIYHFRIHIFYPPSPPPVSMLAPRIQTSDFCWPNIEPGGTGGAIPFKLYEITAAVP